MPKQRGGWKGKPKNGPAKAAAPQEDDDGMFDEVDKYHGLNMIGGSDPADGGDDEDDVMAVQPVLNLQTGGSDDDEEEDGDDDVEEDYDDDDDDDEDEERRAAAMADEDKILTAWGRDKAGFYNNDADVEIDDEAAALEEQEALRLQRKRAAELEDDDVSFGMQLATSRAAAPSKPSAASAKKGAAKGADVERVSKSLGGLSREAKLDVLMSDAPELISLLDEMVAATKEIQTTLEPILAAVAAGRIATGNGLAYLEAKHHTLLAYVSDITFYLLLKAEGRSVKDHPVIERLVACRATLDKMKPLDAKLAATVTRLLKAATDADRGVTSSSSSASAQQKRIVDDDDDEGGAGKGKRRGAAANGGAGASSASLRPNPAALLAHGASSKRAAAGLLGGDDDDDAGASGATGKGKKAASSATGKGAKRGSKRAGDGDEDSDASGGDTGKELDAAIAALEGVQEAGHDAEITGGVYVPLRRSAVNYDDDPAAAKRAREEARKKQRVQRSALYADLRAAYSDAPEEGGIDGVNDGAEGRTAVDDALDKAARERQAFEEDAFTRVSMSKEERKARKAREREKGRWDAMADLENFGDLDALMNTNGDEVGTGKKQGTGKRSLADLEAAVEGAKRRAASGVAASSSALLASSSSAAVGGSKRPRSARVEDDDDGGDGDEGSDDGYDYGDDSGKGRSRGGKRGGRGGGGGGSDGDEEDPFYAAVAAAAERKKARKAADRGQRAADTADYIRTRREGDELREDADGHRKINRTIAANRGLVKYRRKDEKNPRVNYRKKAEEAVKRRKGQVVPMRNAAAEAGVYGGESTGIRTTVTHSRQIRS